MAVIGLRQGQYTRVPWLVGTLAVLVGVMMMLPVVYLAIRAFGGDFLDVISQQRTIDALIRTIGLAACVGAGALAISLPAAWLTGRTDLPLRPMWAVAFALPLVFPSYVGAFALVAALGPRGMLQDVLEPLGVDRLPEIYGFFGAWLCLTLFTFPYLFLSLRAGVERLDTSMEDAARSLGSNAWGAFFRVSLPQLRPAVAAGLLLVCLYTLSDFGAVSILRFDSLTRMIFIQYKSAFDRTEASALALLLVAVALVFVVLESLTRGRARYHAPAVRRQPKVVELGAWRWPAIAFCAGVAGMSLVLPASVLVYWCVRGIESGQSFAFMSDAAWHSVEASSLGALAAVACALPVAIVAVRYPGMLSRTIEKLAYPGFALPGISIALALVFFASNYAPWIYQTLSLLVVAYVIRFLPQALGSCRTSLLQTNPATEQAARSLGRGAAYVFGRVTLPQLSPGMTIGALLVFLTVMKELPVTLLLSPIGFDTLATEIWASTNEAMFARAAVPALALVAISAIPAIMVMRSGRDFE
jgi:iron(III) transport system permease protein